MENEVVFKLYYIGKYVPSNLEQEAKDYMKNHIMNCTLSNELEQRIYNHKGKTDWSHTYTINQLFNCIKHLSSEPQTPFEYETRNGKLSKFVVNTIFNENGKDFRLSIVVRPMSDKIITCWRSNVDFVYKIDMSRYDSD